MSRPLLERVARRKMSAEKNDHRLLEAEILSALSRYPQYLTQSLAQHRAPSRGSVQLKIQRAKVPLT